MINNYCTSYSYRQSEEMAKIKRCREMVAKDCLNDNEKDLLKKKMDAVLKSMRHVA